MNKKELGKIIHELGNKIQVIGGLAYTNKPKEEMIQAYIESVGTFRKLVDAIELLDVRD